MSEVLHSEVRRALKEPAEVRAWALANAIVLAMLDDKDPKINAALDAMTGPQRVALGLAITRAALPALEALAALSDLAQRLTDPDDNLLEQMARAHDREDAAQRGEPSPWDGWRCGIADNMRWRDERVEAIRAAFEVYRAALQQEGRS